MSKRREKTTGTAKPGKQPPHQPPASNRSPSADRKKGQGGVTMMTEQELMALKRDYPRAYEMIATQAFILGKLKDDGKLTIVENGTVRPGQTLVSVPEASDRKALSARALADIRLSHQVALVGMVLTKVDAFAAVAPSKTVLLKAVEGLGKELAVRSEAFMKAASDAGLDPSMQDMFQQQIYDHIKAIHLVGTDGGDKLRDLARSKGFAELVDAFYARPRRKAEGITTRWHEYGQRFYHEYNGAARKVDRRSWAEAAEALIADLGARRDPLDHADQQILNDLDRENTSNERGDLFQSHYNNAKRTINEG